MSLDPLQFPESAANLRPPSWVYFAGPRDRTIIKIGYTKWPRCRLRDLAAWSPLPLELFAVAPGGAKDELKLHWRFVELYSHKEWFRASPALLDLVEFVERAGRLPDDVASIVVPAKFRLPGHRPLGRGRIPTEKRAAAAIEGWRIKSRRKLREAAA